MFNINAISNSIIVTKYYYIYKISEIKNGIFVSKTIKYDKTNE